MKRTLENLKTLLEEMMRLERIDPRSLDMEKQIFPKR